MFVYGRHLILLAILVSCGSGFQPSPTRTRTRGYVIGQRVPKSIPSEHTFLSSNNSDEEEPQVIKEEKQETNNTVRDATFSIFKLFSYCIQFLGAFFFTGFILNLAGFGYTVDLEHGLVIDRMENIRNEIQFEREIERETMEGSKYLIAPKVPE